MGAIKNHVMPHSTSNFFFSPKTKWRYVTEDELSHHGLLKYKQQIPSTELGVVL